MSIKSLEERIAELKEYQSWGEELTPEEQDELARKEIALRELKLDMAQPKTFNLEALDNFESLQRVIEERLAAFGLEVALERGLDLKARRAYYNDYSRFSADTWHEDYPRGTRLISISYGIPLRYEHDYETITFPESYLEEGADWKKIERERREAKEAKEEAERAKRLSEQEEKERAELARLQEKYA